jgi:hypothetical protein
MAACWETASGGAAKTAMNQNASRWGWHFLIAPFGYDCHFLKKLIGNAYPSEQSAA